MCENKQKPSVSRSEDFRKKCSTSDVESSTSDVIFGKNFASEIIIIIIILLARNGSRG